MTRFHSATDATVTAADYRRVDRLNEQFAEIDTNLGYRIRVNPTRRVRGWPVPNSKPFQLSYVDGGHIASFATLNRLEYNLRGRAGC